MPYFLKLKFTRLLKFAFALALFGLSHVVAAQCVLSITPASPVPNNQNLSFTMTCGGVAITQLDPYYVEVPPGISVGSTGFAIPNAFGLGNSGIFPASAVAPGGYSFAAFQCVPAGTPGSGVPKGTCPTNLPNALQVDKQSVTVVAAGGANQAPTVTISTPNNNLNYIAPATININANASDPDGTVASVQYFANGTAIGSSTTAPFSFVWNNVVAGSYAVTARATDNLGLQGAASTALNINVVNQNQAPTVTITAPANNTSFTSPATVNLTVNAADADGTVASVQYFANGTAIGSSAVAPFSFAWTNVAAGSYAITARATDNLGLQGAASAAINVVVSAANQAPTVTITSPANNARFLEPAVFIMTVNASDPDGTVASVQYYVNGTATGMPFPAGSTVSLGTYFAGSYVLTARATDNLGLQGAASAAINVVVSANQAPTATITAPANNASFVAPAAVNLTANAADTDGTVTRVQYFANGNSIGSSTVAPFSFAWTNVAVGNYALTATAIDNLGVQGAASAAVNIVVSAANQAPTATITAPTNNASASIPNGQTSTNVNLQVNAADPDGTVASVQYFANGTAIGTSNTAPFSFAWTNVVAGNYALTARATDNLGLQGAASAAINFTVTQTPNIAPTVSITSPANNAAVVTPTTVTIRATAADSDGTISKVDFFNGATLLGTANAAPYVFNWVNPPAGAASITAVATDNQNATATSAAVVVNVTALPAAPKLACEFIAQPLAIGQGSAVAVALNCTRDGLKINTKGASESGESLSYFVTAGPGSPSLSLAAQTGDATYNFPVGVFNTVGNFNYNARVTLTGAGFAGTAEATAVATVSVISGRGGVISLIEPTVKKLEPGKPVTIRIRALTDTSGPVPGVVVSWGIASNVAGVPVSPAKSTTAANNAAAIVCAANDLPAPGPLPPTDQNGEVAFVFTPGCSGADRTFTFTDGIRRGTLVLAGPNVAVSQLKLVNQGDIVGVNPNVPSTISISVVDAANAPVVAATTTWTMAAADGTVTSPNRSGTDGVASAVLVLREGVAKASIEVCIDGIKDVRCKTIQVRNLKLTVKASGEAILQPLVRQSVDAPRVQLNNIRNRLQQLRVESNVSGDKTGDGKGGADNANVSRTGLFVLGDVEVAKRDPKDGDKGYKLNSKGVTVGADYRVNKDLVVGAAVGALRGNTSVGEGGTQKSKGASISAFAQWLPAANWYGNMIINVGKNTYDSSRVSVSGDLLKARSSSTQQGLQIEGGYAFSSGGNRFTPFVRYELIRAKLKPFDETGGNDAVSISGQSIRSNTVGVGAIAERAISTASGVWIPSARVEYVKESQSQGEVYARLINGTPVLVPLNPELLDTSYGTLGLNLQWLTGVGANLTSSFIGYEQSLGKTGAKSDRVTAGVKIPF